MIRKDLEKKSLESQISSLKDVHMSELKLIKQESQQHKNSHEDTLVKLKSNEEKIMETWDELKLTEIKLEDTLNQLEKTR